LSTKASAATKGERAVLVEPSGAELLDVGVELLGHLRDLALSRVT